MFAVISSTMFITWQKTVGGRIKSDLRFNKFLTWNPFPLPPTDDTRRRAIIEAGAAVLEARSLQPDHSLADLYEPGSLAPVLQAAHDDLDRAVDDLFDFGFSNPSTLERQDRLFSGYRRLAGSA